MILLDGKVDVQQAVTLHLPKDGARGTNAADALVAFGNAAAAAAARGAGGLLRYDHLTREGVHLGQDTFKRKLPRGWLARQQQDLVGEGRQLMDIHMTEVAESCV